MKKSGMEIDNSETNQMGEDIRQTDENETLEQMPDDREDEDLDSERSNLFAAIVRFAFPTAALILAALYVENTYGRIRTENLYYPYFVIGMLVLLTVTVYVDELRKLYRRDARESFVESVRASVYEWQRSIGLVIVGIVYIMLIDVIGFFIATFFGVIAVMLVGGLRDPKIIAGGTLFILVFIHVLFIQLMGLQPPEGPLGL